jgi:hypothetical protein
METAGRLNGVHVVNSEKTSCVFANNLDALKASFEGFRDNKLRQYAPRNCRRCRLLIKSDCFERSKLLKRKQHYHEATIQCDESFKPISVLQLLDGLKQDDLPTWANPTPKEPPATQDRSFIEAQGSGSPTPRIIKIFLAKEARMYDVF